MMRLKTISHLFISATCILFFSDGYASIIPIHQEKSVLAMFNRFKLVHDLQNEIIDKISEEIRTGILAQKQREWVKEDPRSFLYAEEQRNRVRCQERIPSVYSD